MKNIGQYNQDLSVPRKKDIDSLETRVKTNEDNIAMAESDIEGLNTDVGTLKTDVSSVKTALNSKQDTVVGAASTIVENNLTAGKVLVSNASGKVSTASVGIDDINPDGKYLKTSGGMVNGPVYLLGGVGGPLTVKSGSVTLNESYSIGYGDGNYNFIQINGNFLLMKGGSTQQGVCIASSTDGTNGNLEIYVNNDSQNVTTYMNIASNGVISLNAEDGSGESYMVNNVRVTGIADGIASSDAVNLGQLNKLAPKGIANITFGNIVLSSAFTVLPNTLFDCTYTGKIRSSTVIGGGASIPVSNTSYIVSVSGSDFDYSYGPCAVQKDKDSWNVTIRMLCTSRDAPNSITVPCLVL